MPDRAYWAGRRVWLTGHTGFKGAWLALWLQALGAEVHGFSAPEPVSEPSLYALADIATGMAGETRADLRSAQAVRAAVGAARPEVVLHLAAQALVRRGMREPARTFAVNAGGTAEVLDAVCARAPDATVVVVTSDKCYRNDARGRPFAEDDPLGGTDPYSASKAAQEHVATAYRGLGLRLATVRAGNAIGGGDWAPDRLLADAMRAATARTPLRIRAPSAVRPWQHVLCPLEGYLMVAQRLASDPAAATAWNFGPDPGDARPVGEVVQRLAALWPEPLAVVMEGDAAGEPTAPAAEAPVLRLDASRARERLGWRPRWDLDAALAATVSWHLAHRDGRDLREHTRAQITAFEAASAP